MMLESYERMARMRKMALSRFNEMYLNGVIRRWIRRVLGKPIQLQFLDQYNPNDYTPYHLKRQAISLDHIVGTSGRMDRFDHQFRPMQTRGRDRWASVAAGMMTDITAIPPVELIQIGDDYFVVDGHHRVSVARALHKVFIDANVTRWEPAT
jgi:hypothetical protein